MEFWKKQSALLPFIIVTAVAIALILFGASCGLLHTPDSEQYINAANEIATGRLPGTTGSAYIYWPPLYPLIISCFSDPGSQIIILNVLLVVAIALLLFTISKCFIGNYLIRVVFFTTSLCGVQMIMISVFLWSELIFTFLLLATLYCLLKQSQNIIVFFLIVVLLSLLCLQRYAGIFIVVGSGICILVDSGMPLKHRLIKSSIAIAASLLLLSYWWHTVDGISILERIAFDNAPKALYLSGAALGKLFTPGPSWIASAFVAGLILLITLTHRNPKKTPIMTLVILISFYLMGFLLVEDSNADEAERFISVIAPLVLMIVFYFADSLYTRQKPVTKKVLLIALALWMIYPLYRTVHNVQQWHTRSCIKM